MADDQPTSQYPQLPPDPVQRSWLAENRRGVILGGTAVVLILIIAIAPRLRGGRSTTLTANTSNQATTSAPNGLTTNSTAGTTFQRFTVTAVADDDHDGLSNTEEQRLGTSPTKTDSDGDLLSDYDEVKIYQTDPLKPDTDSDGVPDGLEVRQGTNPRGTGPLFDTNQAIHKNQTK